jgi:hypothetical protein
MRAYHIWILAACLLPSCTTTKNEVTSGSSSSKLFAIYVWESKGNSLTDLHRKGGNSEIRRFIFKKCGGFDEASTFTYNPDVTILAVKIPIVDRYRFMKGMYSVLKISEADLARQRQTMKQWSSERARKAALRDIAENRIKIYWAGGVGLSPCGIPKQYLSLVKDFPHADAGIGCDTDIPSEALIYGTTYNQTVLNYLLKKQAKHVEPIAPANRSPAKHTARPRPAAGSR